MPRSRFWLAALLGLLVAACRPSREVSSRQSDRPHDTVSPAAAPAPPVADSGVAGPLPRIGLAVSDSTGGWCAEFMVDSAAPALARGARVTIVFAGPAAVPALGARIADVHPGQCPAAFPQPRWIDYAAYRLDPSDAGRGAGRELPPVALVVASASPWVRGADGLVRAELDGDGRPEEARRCTADEGEHFTLWSPLAAGGHVRRWHEYFDWGGFTDPTCKPGEDGLG